MNMRKKAGFVMGLTVALSSISMVYAQDTQETQDITLSLVTEYGDDIQILGSPESTDVLQVYDGSDGTYLMGVDGTALTEAKYEDAMVGKNGYIAAKEYSEDINTVGLLDQDGNEVIPFQYGNVTILSTKWAVGITVEETQEGDYDYSTWDDYSNSHWVIKQVDVYYLPDAKCVANLERSDYQEAKAYDDRIKILSRADNTVNVYDSEFNEIATGLSSLSMDYDEYGDYFSKYTVFTDQKNNKVGLKDLDGKVVLKPMKYASLDKTYAEGYYKARKSGEYGYELIKADGTVVCPLECDGFRSYPINRADSDDEDAYVAFGYVACKDGDTVKYADESGTITGDFAYSYTVVKNYGASSLTTVSPYTLLSADGMETALDGYESVDSVVNSKGMYYLVSQTDEYNNTVYGLIDWHGEVVIPCVYGTLEVTGDGKYAVVSEYSSYGPYSLYELTYPEDDTKTVEEATTDSTEAAQVESETETQEAQDASESESTQEELSE